MKFPIINPLWTDIVQKKQKKLGFGFGSTQTQTQDSTRPKPKCRLMDRIIFRRRKKLFFCISRHESGQYK